MNSEGTSDQNKGVITFLIIVIVLLCWAWISSQNRVSELESTKEELTSEVESWQDEAATYQSLLEEANNNIDEANSIIENAQGYAWDDYDSMGYALEELTTVDSVSY